MTSHLYSTALNQASRAGLVPLPTPTKTKKISCQGAGKGSEIENE